MFFLFADVATGYMMAFTTKAKNAFITAFINVLKTIKKYGKEVKIFRDMGKYLEENGYFHEKSTPEAH